MADTYEQIVRELAESNPYVDIAYWHRNEIECAQCGERKGEKHAADCLWLRAKRALQLNGNGGVMHALYDQETGTFPCCGKTTAETAVNDLMTLDPIECPVTCKGQS
jgi:hypothetical protein